MSALFAALTWEPQVKGALYVLLAALILCGSCYMLLATNMGARLGFLLAGAGLFGWLATLGMIWWVYARGPVGPDPTWETRGIVTTELVASRNPSLNGFPKNWDKIDPTDPKVADALPAVDSQIVGPRAMFRTPAEYVIVGAYEKGGGTHGPFGIDAPRPFDLWHDAHYLVVQVQKALPPAVGQPPRADLAAKPVSVVLLRNLGGKRLHPAVFALSSTALFLLFCYKLHVRDKELWAAQETETRRPQPVAR